MGSVGATSSEIGEEEEGEGNPVSSKVAGEVTVVATTSSVVGVEGGIGADVSGTSSMSVARAVVLEEEQEEEKEKEEEEKGV